MKTLVTHINPHLDDIAAIWLFKKFHPDFADAKIEFISASQGNKPIEKSEEKVFLGVGRGKFDEHKGDLEDCAASLVWKNLKGEGLTPKDEAEANALTELVEWVRLGDLGRLPIEKFDDFTVPSFIRVFGSEQAATSLENTDLGLKILDRIYRGLINKHKAEKDWEVRVEFETKWGKGVAVKSAFVNRGFCKNKGVDICLMVDPRYGSVQFFTPKPKNEGDLEPIYRKVKELDPQATWFLHQSHHMVICGSGSAPDSKRTKLSFDQLIEVAKNP